MKIRKSKEIMRVLQQKGFVLNPEKKHHKYFCLVIDGIKQHIYTYFSHGKKECSKKIMSEIKKQLKFKYSDKAEQFFDCPMSRKNYIDMLLENGDLSELPSQNKQQLL